MTILCGTDFSAHAGDALRTAVSLAKHSNEELLLVHVSAFLGSEAPLAAGGGVTTSASAQKFAAALEEIRLDLDRRLQREVKSVEGRGVTVRSELLQGTPDEVLVTRADSSRARLIVIGALGARSSKLWTLGGTADRVSQKARVPVLVVRRAQAFEKWIGGREPLRVLVGVDDSDSCEAAVAGLQGFAAALPCKIIGVHVFWPPEQRAKSGSSEPIPLGAGHPEVEKALRSGLEKRLAPTPKGSEIELRMIGGLGRPADHLVKIAADLQSDLIVLGNHQRTGFEKFWHGSVSHRVIDRAQTNVLCVPSSTR